MSMSDFRNLLPVLIIATGLSACAGNETLTPQLGVQVTQEQLSGLDLIVDSRGGGLPAGGATAAAGEMVFRNRCQSCHGEGGEGRTGATVLVGGSMQSEGPPLKTVGSYWPYASTLFDFIRRAMPADAPKSLTDDEVYAVTAYVLYLNDIVGQSDTVSRDTLAAIRMPNAEGFVDRSTER